MLIRLKKIHISLGFPDLANTNKNRMPSREHTVHTLYKKLFVYLKFTFSQICCILSGNPTSSFLNGSVAVKETVC